MEINAMNLITKLAHLTSNSKGGTTMINDDNRLTCNSVWGNAMSLVAGISQFIRNSVDRIKWKDGINKGE